LLYLILVTKKEYSDHIAY